MSIKKVCAIHDLSGYGRASLTVAIPVISRMGAMVCPLPTAVLSAQTFYSEYEMTDLTDNILPFAEHWRKIGVKFDCIYSGFLASKEQIDMVSQVVDMFRTDDNMVVIDTVMGDDGEQFSLFGDEFVDKMKGLVKKADIITPNFTEAGLLLGHKDFEGKSLDTAQIWAKQLSEWGIDTVVITSVPTGDDRLCTLAYSKNEDKFYKSYCKKYPVRYSGTGDAYTSVLVGAILRGENLGSALNTATDFLSVCIKESFEKEPENKEFQLEQHLKMLVK